MALIIPKNNADETTLDATLKIYYDANDWVKNEILIDKLSQMLDNLGIEEEKKERQSYTKKTQVLAYYGFIIWENETNPQSRRRITDLGRHFYEARLSKDSIGCIEIILESLSNCTFGRNVTGCNSDSDLEPPNIFLKSALLLEGINLNEFAYILQKMEFDNAELADAIFDVSLKRKRGEIATPNADAAKWKDPKPILALGNWGVFDLEKKNGLNHYTLNKLLIENYSGKLMALRTKNTEKRRFNMNNNLNDNIKEPKQIIYYGAPGTGKSHKIDEDTEGFNVIRTTFHPDSDYSTFVGAYKPWMNGNSIVYKFIKQAFLKAYLQAWKKYSVGGDIIEPQFLIIEEINRGNCAQIFGDLFQLLDRSDDGFSTYPIEADSDIQDAIRAAFSGEDEYKLNEDFDIEGVVEKYKSNYDKTLTEDVKEGRVLLLPKNLYIWATMNTSDQSLFPIDSAFKRRWEWKYIPIANHADKDWHIKFEYKVNGDTAGEEASVTADGVKKVDKTWWEFVDGINKHIYKATHSEDKKLGFFFCKPTVKKNPDNADEEPTIITPETFVSKVVFYLWQDVFKISGSKKGVFKDLTFDMFYLKTEEMIEGNPDKINFNVLDEFITRAIKEPE